MTLPEGAVIWEGSRMFRGASVVIRKRGIAVVVIPECSGPWGLCSWRAAVVTRRLSRKKTTGREVPAGGPGMTFYSDTAVRSRGSRRSARGRPFPRLQQIGQRLRRDPTARQETIGSRMMVLSVTVSQILYLIRDLVARRDVRISSHGYEELAADGILVRDVLAGVDDATVVEDYPEYHKGPSVLVPQWDQRRRPLHVLWGIPRNATQPAVVVTAYRPAPDRWSSNFLRRRR